MIVFVKYLGHEICPSGIVFPESVFGFLGGVELLSFYDWGSMFRSIRLVLTDWALRPRNCPPSLEFLRSILSSGTSASNSAALTSLAYQSGDIPPACEKFTYTLYLGPEVIRM